MCESDQFFFLDQTSIMNCVTLIRNVMHIIKQKFKFKFFNDSISIYLLLFFTLKFLSGKLIFDLRLVRCALFIRFYFTAPPKRCLLISHSPKILYIFNGLCNKLSTGMAVLVGPSWDGQMAVESLLQSPLKK